MTFNDLSRLRWPLLTCVVLAAAGVQLMWIAEAGFQSRREELRRAEENYRRGHGRLQQAEQDEAQIRETIGRFRALEARGVVGQEQRLEWVERLRAAREHLRLPALDYELRPRRALEGAASSAASAAGYRLSASAMRLRAELVQEEDLLRLLAELRAEPSAIVRPVWCRMSRPTAGGQGLTAECELEWITVEPGREAQK
jgi:hypothetical protein